MTSIREQITEVAGILAAAAVTFEIPPELLQALGAEDV